MQYQSEFLKIENEPEVIKMAQGGCRDSMTALYRKYLPFLKRKALQLEKYHKNLSYDDVLQEAGVYLIEAVKTYDSSQGKSLKYWIVTCVSLRLIEYWKTQTIIKTPKFIEGDELESKASFARNMKLFSEVSTRNNNKSEEKEWTPRSMNESENPVLAASLSEEKEILHSAIKKLSREDRIIIRGRMEELSYEECGEMVVQKLKTNISTHRESMRQRAVRAFLRLEKAVKKLMHWDDSRLIEGAFYSAVNKQSKNRLPESA